MNKKFSTLMVAALLATSVNVGAQTTIDEGTTAGAAGIYTVQKTVGTTGNKGGAFDRFVREDAANRTNNLFPTVSPFELKTAYGAKPISKLENANGISDGRYFQFALSESFHLAPALPGDGTELLTMVWVNSELAGKKAHFEIQIENVNNANVPNNRIALDRTLWKVTANKDAAGTVLYYELQNKASEAILQLSIDNVIGAAGTKGEREIALEIVSGQTNWRWADGQVASEDSKIEAAAGKVLQNQLRAQYDNGMTIRLARRVDATSNKVTLGAIKMNSNQPFAVAGDAVTANDATFYPITFESWEANPIILTADQINAELGNEVILTEDKKTKGYFHFEFNPDVVGDENIMLASNFEAEAPLSGQKAYDRLPGDAPDGFVRFKKKGSSEYLRVDTAYHDPSLNGRYDLKMTVDQITYPRYAVAADGLIVTSGGALARPNGTALTNVEIYGDKAIPTDAPNTARAFVQLKRQSNFRPLFYPSTQSLRLQSEMNYKAAKKELNATGATYAPWWMQMAEDAMWETSSDAKGSPDLNYGYMGIAECAVSPSIDPVNSPASARGYYPSYTQDISSDLSVGQGLRLIHYAKSWGPTDLTIATERNGYSPNGATDNDGANKMFWNAVGNVFQGDATNNYATEHATPFIGTSNVFVFDPAATTKTATLTLTHLAAAPNTVTAGTANPVIYAPQYALAHSNLARIVTLTPTHKVLTSAVHDMVDDKYNGLNTFITLKTTKTEPGLDEVARIPEGFYYIRNANTKNSDLTKVGDYRYEDLAATNAMFTYWNANTKLWDRGVAALDGDGAKNGGANAAAVNVAMDEDKHKKDNANKGNLVYSTDKKVIPSAQWYIKGNGAYYTVINRESGRDWNTNYWWKTSEPDVYVNLATYTDGTGLLQTYRDTIRIEAIPTAELTDKYMGYLHVNQDIVKADTSLYSIGMTSLGDVRLSLTDVDGVLKMVVDAKGDYKMERALVYDKDIYSQVAQQTDSLIYGYVPTVNAKLDSTKMLMRTKYYIYKDEVSANSGNESTSIKTRKYITLENGQYKLTPIRVKDVNGDGYTVNVDKDEKENTEGVLVRRGFYVKQISTVDPSQFVLVDPLVVTQNKNNTTTTAAYGARMFANQLTAEVQPSGLVSEGTSNSYANSVLNINKVQAYNYRDIRSAGVDRDTVEFYSAKLDGQYLLSENTVKGANVGLLESLDKLMNKNTAMFLDTANVSHPECPRFLIGLRSKDSIEVSNLGNHNRHLFTDADYLINMIDSVANNSVYVYKNQDFNQTKYYRLGFIRARHQGSTLKFEKSGKTFDLSTAALGDRGLNIATFAFRYANTNRDEFYIETMYDNNTRGWLKTINHVLVVVPDIQQADVFSFNDRKENGAPTSNDNITTSTVSVISGKGVVTVKNAAGKKVSVSSILGKAIVAETTLTSDNATISVPAGIVVVAVEGEEAAKVVVE